MPPMPPADLVRHPLGPADFAEGELRPYLVGAREILVCLLDGTYFGLDDLCNHAGCALSGGRRRGRVIVCPCHRVAFDLTTGRNESAPHLCGDQRTVPLQVDGGTLYALLEETAGR